MQGPEMHRTFYIIKLLQVLYSNKSKQTSGSFAITKVVKYLIATK